METSISKLMQGIHDELDNAVATLNDWMDSTDREDILLGNLQIIRTQKSKTRVQKVFVEQTAQASQTLQDVQDATSRSDDNVSVIDTPPFQVTSSHHAKNPRKPKILKKRTDFVHPVETEFYSIPTDSLQTRWKACPISKEDLEDMYQRQKKSPRQIAEFILELYGGVIPVPTLSTGPVVRWLKDAGCTIRGVSEASLNYYATHPGAGKTRSTPKVKLTETQIQRLSDMTYANGKYAYSGNTETETETESNDDFPS